MVDLKILCLVSPASRLHQGEFLFALFLVYGQYFLFFFFFFIFSREFIIIYLSTQASLKLSNRLAAYGNILSSGTQQVTLVPGYWQFNYVKKVKSNLQLSTKWLFIKFYLLVLLQLTGRVELLLLSLVVMQNQFAF